MAEPRPHKLARLASLRGRLPYISQNALASILQIAEREALPTAHRKDIREARDSVVHQQTPYGPIHRIIDVGSEHNSVKLEIQHPAAMLYYACSTSPGFSNMVRRTFVKRPPTLVAPWTFVLYADEISPGNQLAHQNDRKVWGLYWSLLEFGSATLSHEDPLHDTHACCSLETLIK